MKNLYLVLILSIILSVSCKQKTDNRYQPYNIFSVKGEKTLLNGEEIILRGLRLSNALMSDAAASDLIANIDTFAYYGINSFSIYLQGSRFGDLKGYTEDCKIDSAVGSRMSRIIEDADKKGMVVLVGCLYYGASEAKWDSWTQKEAELALASTVRWLSDHNYRNVFIDVDNEGMARKAAGFDNRALVLAAKAADSSFLVATNYKGDPPPEADLAIHHSFRAEGKPYIETEGSPSSTPGGYWGSYSKQGEEYGNGPDLYQYINIGIYTDSMKAAQVKAAFDHFDRDEGYFLASTWLQCVPPEGPNHSPGGYGTATDPGIRWWLDAVKERFGEYRPGK